jgi:hypothetical protein
MSGLAGHIVHRPPRRVAPHPSLKKTLLASPANPRRTLGVRRVHSAKLPIGGFWRNKLQDEALASTAGSCTEPSSRTALPTSTCRTNGPSAGAAPPTGMNQVITLRRSPPRPMHRGVRLGAILPSVVGAIDIDGQAIALRAVDALPEAERRPLSILDHSHPFPRTQSRTTLPCSTVTRRSRSYSLP